MESKRGAFLPILLGVNATAITLASIALVVDHRDIQNFMGPLPDWFNLYVVGLLLARMIALWGIWNWRRWAVYTYFLLEGVEVGMGLFYFTAFLTFQVRALIGIPSFLILLAIYFLALKPRWQLFK